MAEKIYANKIVRLTLNAYMRAVADYGTISVFIGTSFNTTFFKNAMWENGQILVRWKDESDNVHGTTSLNDFPIDIQNFVTARLLESMQRAIMYAII